MINQNSLEVVCEKNRVQVCHNTAIFCIICYFYSDDFEPIFEVPPPKYTAEQILRTLLDPCISESKICNVRPVNITQSATYVVNMQMLEHQDDIKMITLIDGNILDHTLYCLECKLSLIITSI